MEGPTIKGRGLSDVRITTTATDAGILIRADCAENPESWCEVELPLACLFDLLERVLVAHPLCLPAELRAVHEVAEKMRL